MIGEQLNNTFYRIMETFELLVMLVLMVKRPAIGIVLRPKASKVREVVIKPPNLRGSGVLKQTPYNLDGLQGEWIELPLGDSMSAQGILVMPKLRIVTNLLP